MVKDKKLSSISRSSDFILYTLTFTLLKNPRILKDSQVLVTAAGEVHHDELISLHLRRALNHFSDRMSRFERRDNPFHVGQCSRRVQRLSVTYVRVFHPPLPVELCVLRADSGIIEAG